MQIQRWLNLSWMYSIFLKFANGNVERRANVWDDKIRMQRYLIISKFERVSNQDGSSSCNLDPKDPGGIIRRRQRYRGRHTTADFNYWSRD